MRTADVLIMYKNIHLADDFNFIMDRLKELHPESNSRYKWTEIGAGRLFADFFKVLL